MAGGGVSGLWQEGKLVWSVRYLNDKGNPSSSQHHHHGKHKATVRIHINKDDIHALIPISKVFYLITLCAFSMDSIIFIVESIIVNSNYNSIIDYFLFK